MWAESQATAVPALIDTFSLQQSVVRGARLAPYVTFPHHCYTQSAGSAEPTCAKLRRLPKSKLESLVSGTRQATRRLAVALPAANLKLAILPTDN